MSLLKLTSYGVILAVVLYYARIYILGCKYEGTERLDGKVAIVTGANTGLGKETALDFVKRGARVYMACRSESRALGAKKDIQTETGVNDDQLIFLPLDLGSLQSVRNFAAAYKQRETKVDILMNNAGVMWVPQTKTVDRYEQTFHINHLGHYLLTHLLLDQLIAAAPSRVVTVSSLGHSLLTPVIQFEDIMFEKNYNRHYVYGQSKLANILFTKELARRLKGTGVTTYSLHPGAVTTELVRYTPVLGNSWVFAAMWPTRYFLKDPYHGAQTQIRCAVDSSLAKDSGKYYSDCAETLPSGPAQDDAMARRLWDVSADLVKLQPQEAHPALQRGDSEGLH